MFFPEDIFTKITLKLAAISTAFCGRKVLVQKNICTVISDDDHNWKPCRKNKIDHIFLRIFH